MKRLTNFIGFIALTCVLGLSMQSCITLTAKKQRITLTSSPSGARVYGLTDIDHDGNLDDAKYIGTTPISYEAKRANTAFYFSKDGYEPEVVKAEKKGRWAAYLLGNIGWMPYGHIIDVFNLYKYKKTGYNVVLSERKPLDISTLSPKQTGMNKVYEINNVKALITPKYSTLDERKALSGKKIFKKYKKAVFMIFGENNYTGAQGSGFIINSQGLAISNYHNFSGMSVMGIKLYDRDKIYQIKKEDIYAFNEEEDYIIFKLPQSILTDIGEKEFDYIPVACSNVEIGDQVFAIGSPKGYENTLSAGLVSQFRELPYTIQINAPIDHGSSGGALINEYGEVVGITSAGRDDSGASLNFAIDLLRVLNKYK